MKILYSILLLISVFLLQNSAISDVGNDGYNRYLSGLGIAASYVGVSSNTAFNSQITGSMEMWVHPTNLSGTFKSLISKGATGNASFIWAIGTDSKQLLKLSGMDFINSDGISIPLNTWTHVAVTWQNGPDYVVKFYVNGVKSGIDIASTATWVSNTDMIRIGGSQAFPSNFFQGYLDEARFWNITLSPQKINANRFVSIGDVSTSNASAYLTTSYFYNGLVASWNFNNGTPNDLIGGFNGTFYGSAAVQTNQMFAPVPYNFSLKLGGKTDDFVVVQHNTIMNQLANGTIEMWYRPASFATEQVLTCKGVTPSSLSLLLGVTATTGKLYFGNGTSVTQNTTGSSLALNQWNHIAVTWSSSGSTITVKFYRNGKQNGNTATITGPIPANSNWFRIGNSGAYNLPAKGFIDELKVWQVVRTEQELSRNMFRTLKGLASSDMICGYDFDGSLLNFSQFGGFNASFNTLTNECRFSGYANDSIPGAFGNAYVSHTTAINRTGTPNPFINGYNMSVPFLAIPDNFPEGVSDSIFINSTITLSAVEAFLSIEHSYIGDVVVTLRAPNGYTSNLINRQGAAGDNVLAFFSDDFQYNASAAGFNPPWTFVKPTDNFGTFGNSPAGGWWKLRVIDMAAGDAGVLEGWGIRLNNLVKTESNITQVPKVYRLYQNYPNPFNPETNIKFDLPVSSNVTIRIYDIMGRVITELLDKEMEAGSHIITYDASALSSGTYFYRINTGTFSDVKRMILVK